MWKILTLELCNFSRIETGMGISHLMIDFQNLKNSINLFIGKNGSGKTSVMSCIHPFAYNSGTGDTTANQDLIIEGKNGKKEIVILSDTGIVYTCTHIYNRNKDNSLTVKSFLKENGEELNDAGTTTTFKALILERMGIDESFLSLLSLGNTVTGFVKFTSGERKKFATKIFMDLLIYNTYYKNASSIVRDIKSVLNNVTTKLNRYRNYNQEELKSEELQIDQKISSLERELDEIMVQYGSISKGISLNGEFISSYSEKETQVNELFSKISQLKDRKRTNKDEIIIQNDIHEMEQSIHNYEVTTAGIEVNIKSELDMIESKKSSKSLLEETMHRLEHNINIQELESLKASLIAENISLEVDELDVPEMDKDALIRASIYLEELRGMCVDLTYESNDNDTIKDCLNNYLKNHDILERMNESYNELLNEMKSYRLIQDTKEVLKGISNRTITESCEDSNKCGYYRFYQTFLQSLNQSSEDARREMQKLEEKESSARNVIQITTIIRNLYRFLNKNKSIFQILPEEVFNPSTFILLYLENREICNRPILNKMIDTLERLDKVKKNKEELNRIEQQIASIQDSKSTYDTMKQQIQDYEKEISDLTEKIERLRENFNYNKEKQEELTKLLDSLKEELSITKELTESRVTLNQLKEELSNMDSKMKEIEVMNRELEKIQSKKQELQELKESLMNRKQEIHMILTTINELEKEQEELAEKYDNCCLIKDAVSPSKGVPLEFIEYYIKERMINMVNELLDSIYHGNLRLVKEKTIIDEGNFLIPYKKGHKIIDDISKASDGERAILSLSFSLTLIQLASDSRNRGNQKYYHDMYNLFLLDEMDGPLDIHTTPLYIQLIQNYMKIVKSEQIFLISHNSMFDMYPVNVFLTSDEPITNVGQIDVVRLYESN